VTGPIFILTHHPQDAPRDPAFTLVSGDIRDVVREALEAAGGKNLVVTGGSVPRQCVQAGLVDEIVHLVPVLLGDGLRFYDRPGTSRISLERDSVAPGRADDRLPLPRLEVAHGRAHDPGLRASRLANSQ